VERLRNHGGSVLTDIFNIVQGNPRLETGPLKIGNDWTGYFFRGDEAMSLAGQLQALADCMDRGDECVVPVIPKRLREIAAELLRVNERDDNTHDVVEPNYHDL
jgi:hypothetical protein